MDETWQVGLLPEKAKPSTFPAKSRYGFRRECEKMGRRGVVFCDVNHAPLLPLGSISAKLPTNTCPGGGMENEMEGLGLEGRGTEMGGGMRGNPP